MCKLVYARLIGAELNLVFAVDGGARVVGWHLDLEEVDSFHRPAVERAA